MTTWASHTSSQYRRGLVITAAGTVIVSFEALFVRLVAADAWTVIWWRGILLGLTMLAVLVLTGRRLELRNLKLPALAAIVAFGATVFFFVTAINATTVANTLVIASSAPLFAALQSWLFLRERQTRSTWGAVLIVFAGIALIFSGSVSTSLIFGDMLALGYAVSLAAYYVALRRCPDGQLLTIIALGGLLSALLAWPLASPTAVSSNDVWVLITLGVAIVPASTLLLSLGTQFLQASHVTLIMMLEMLLGPLWVWLAMNEVPAATTVYGGILVLATVVAHSCLSVARQAPPAMAAD